MQPGPTHWGDSSGPVVTSLADIYMPSREISDALIEYDRHWNSWVHCATEYTRFQEQHDLRIEEIAADIQGDNVDLPWLAMYLSVICVSDPTRKDTFYYVWLFSLLIILTGIAHNDERRPCPGIATDGR